MKQFITKYFKSDLNSLIKARETKDNDLAILFFGRIMGKIELMPTIMIFCEKDTSLIETITNVMTFTNYVFYHKLVSKPDCYDAIMEVLNENESE